MRFRPFTVRHKAEHEQVERELDKHEHEIVDMAKRLVRLEAEVGIYRPFFTDMGHHDEGV